ncbi:MAG: HAD-IB family hydrolase [Bacteroidales bacterium]|nr:HAD-IB family hydrolase [Bacteroidales bacterium]
MSSKENYIVFIDLDKTLLTVNSGKVLAWAAYKEGLLSNRNLIKAISLSLIYKLHLINSVKTTVLMVEWLKGLSETAVENFAKKVTEQKLINLIRPSMIEEINKHKKQKARIIILSAALPYICQPLANHLNLDGVICSTMEIDQGLFTGKPQGKMCMEEEKAVRIREYCQKNNFNLQDAYCYGDSYSDRFVLDIVGNPVCVNPDNRLDKLAIAKAWILMN